MADVLKSCRWFAVTLLLAVLLTAQVMLMWYMLTRAVCYLIGS